MNCSALFTYRLASRAARSASFWAEIWSINGATLVCCCCCCTLLLYSTYSPPLFTNRSSLGYKQIGELGGEIGEFLGGDLVRERGDVPQICIFFLPPLNILPSVYKETCFFDPPVLKHTPLPCLRLDWRARRRDRRVSRRRSRRRMGRRFLPRLHPRHG